MSGDHSTHGYYILRKSRILKPRIRSSFRDLKFPRKSGKTSGIRDLVSLGQYVLLLVNAFYYLILFVTTCLYFLSDKNTKIQKNTLTYRFVRFPAVPEPPGPVL